MRISVFDEVHTFLVFLHVVAIAVGLGAVLMADWLVLTKIMFAAVPAGFSKTIAELSGFVRIGLAALWMTGLALIACDWTEHGPTLLQDDKLRAKIAIVCTLTVNALILHWRVLPALVRREGRSLFGRPWHEAILPTLVGAVSFSSWLFAAYLGAGRDLDGKVGLTALMTLYGSCVAAVWVAAVTLALIGRRPSPRS